MTELQKKVLLFLLSQVRELLREDTCDELAVPGLSVKEQQELTRELYVKSGEIDEWDGFGYSAFSVSSLAGLAKSWIEN